MRVVKDKLKGELIKKLLLTIHKMCKNPSPHNSLFVVKSGRSNSCKKNIYI